MEKHIAHIQENFEIFDFKLTDEEMAQMIAVDRNERLADYRACKTIFIAGTSHTSSRGVAAKNHGATIACGRSCKDGTAKAHAF